MDLANRRRFSGQLAENITVGRGSPPDKPPCAARPRPGQVALPGPVAGICGRVPGPACAIPVRVQLA